MSEALDNELRQIREAAEARLMALQARADEIVQTCQLNLRAAVLAAGFKWCKKCDGTGAIERLDSGYMKKFGLRPWNGCKACGGGGETKGKGYL